MIDDIDIDRLITLLRGYRNSMSEFDPEEIDLMIDALEYYKEPVIA